MSARPASRAGVTFLGYLASFATILALWQYLSSQAIIPLLFPSPLSTLRVAIKLHEEGRLVADVLASVRRIAAGFALGSALGILLGVLMGSFATVRTAAEPYVQLFRFLPALAWIPAAMLWLGTGEESKIALLIYTTAFIVALNTMIGVGNVPANRIRAALCFGATRWQLFHMVQFPASVSYMLTGMRLAMGTCFSTIVAAELVAPKAGVGYLIFSARTWMQTEVAFVGIVLLGAMGFAADRLLQYVARRFFHRYQPA